MIAVGLYIQDWDDKTNPTKQIWNRIELFSDEKISVNSSIQNVNDISKTFS